MRSWIALIALAGCGVETTSEIADNVTASNRLASNRLASNRLASNRLASNKLAAADLAADPAGLLSTEDGRDVLSYIVSCALAADQAFDATAPDGITYTFAGQIGLAPAWADRMPTVSERRWVTACVLARTNYYGIAVALSMRGDHPSLAIGDGERSAFQVFEGGFWGDLFEPDHPTEYACASQRKIQNGQKPSLALRQCTATVDGTTTLCGFTYMGTCSSACIQDECFVGDELYGENISVYLPNN